MDATANHLLNTSAFGTASDHLARISELEKELAGTQARLSWFTDKDDKRRAIKDSGRFHDLLEYLNNSLLPDDLVISLGEVDDEGVTLFIEDATLDRNGDGDQPILKAKEQEFYVTGTFTVEWNARVRATSEDAASDLIDDPMPSDFDRISVSVYDDAVLEFEVQDYISDHDISDVEPA